ncbi:hypothetical protein [Actinosynnema sp. NPDC023587]|uniref:hypothetical protein n=1 Tax=Actinosynnema sp. NPDC023587 TaxID=3154695 RepID=UPI003402B5F6
MRWSCGGSTAAHTGQDAASVDVSESDLVKEVEAAGFTDVRTSSHQRGGVLPAAVGLLADVPA